MVKNIGFSIYFPLKLGFRLEALTQQFRHASKSFGIHHLSSSLRKDLEIKVLKTFEIAEKFIDTSIMESILLIGACSAVDALGKMLTSFKYINKCTTWGSLGRVATEEMENSSVIPVCEDSSPSVRRSVHFPKVSTISVLHKSSSSYSTSTTSTSSTFSKDGNEGDSNHISNSSPVRRKTSHTSITIENFVEVEVAPMSYYQTPPIGISSPPLQQLRQDYKTNDQTKLRHRFLGHTKRQRRVRRLLAEDVAHRQKRSETILDQKRHEVPCREIYIVKIH